MSAGVNVLDAIDRWGRLIERSHIGWTWTILSSLYAEPHRAYHRLDHILACLAKLDACSLTTTERQTAELALWFHDAVYVPGSPDNEVMSAELLRGMALALAIPHALAERAACCVLATAHKVPPPYDDTQRLVVEIDLSILGEAPDVYARYVAGVRAEYSHVSEEAWRVGRANFLAQMLAREQVFSILLKCEERARSNMAAELANLESR